MSSLLSDHLELLQPYTPGEQASIANLLKLNTNENPYGPSPKALAAMRAAITDDLRLYPDYRATALHNAIADNYQLKAEQVFLGNGSDEILAHVFSAFFLRAGRKLWMPDISYSFYRTWCQLYQVPHRLIPLDAEFGIRMSDYLPTDDMQQDQPCAILFANPNAPTGRALELEQLARLAASWPDSLLVIDEAYVDFGAQSAAALVDKHKNILVIHTLSKSRSLAGLRVGYALGDEALIRALVRLKDSFNSYPLDSIAMAGALAAVQDVAWLETTSQKVIAARTQLSQDLTALGFSCLPSKANFIFATHPRHDAQKIALGLRQHGILVRHFDTPKINQFLRITVGTPAQCKRLTDTLNVVLSA